MNLSIFKYLMHVYFRVPIGIPNILSLNTGVITLSDYIDSLKHFHFANSKTDNFKNKTNFQGPRSSLGLPTYLKMVLLNSSTFNDQKEPWKSQLNTPRSSVKPIDTYRK